MKKLFLFCALLAGIAVMTGCQKDEDVITLKAVMDQDTKAYFGNTARNLPYWDSDDKVKVAGEGSVGEQYTDRYFSRSFGLSTTNSTLATITGVPTRSVYCAIYPADAADKIGSPSIFGTSATIYYKPHQDYIWDATNNRQRVNMPMGAITTSTDKTFIFKNLCSILRINVTNALATNTNFENVDFNVRKITVQSYGAYLSGYANVNLSYSTTNHSTNDPVISVNSIQQTQDNVLSLYAPGYESMGTIAYSNTATNHSKSFDVVVPPFEASKLVLELELYNGNNPLGYFEFTVENPNRVEQNNILPINLNVDRYTTYDYAYFKPGPAFNQAIHNLPGINDVTSISFTSYEGGITYLAEHPNYPRVEVQALNSPYKIYAYRNPETPSTLQINSLVTLMYADTNCSYMFANLPNLISINWNNVDNAGIPCGFQTEDVTNMSYMFAGCRSLTTLEQLSYLNTTNVTNMSHMFEECSSFNGYNQNFTSFNTHNVRKMAAMFKDCSGLSTLNLSSFSTEHVTDMSELFSGCTLLKSISMNNFVISPNTTLTNMCYHLNYSQINNINLGTHMANNPCYITCSENDTWNAMKGQAENYNPPIDPTTALDLRLVARASK